jgi:drug/metabolite transporter (DMT)-like permease
MVLSRSSLWLNLMLISGTWGSSFFFVKLISYAVPPFAFAAARGFIAMTALLAWLAFRGWLTRSNIPGRPPRDRKMLLHVVVLGTTNGWLASALTVIAVRHVDSAMVAMIQAAVPLMVAVLAHFSFTKERLQSRQVTGILIGMLGIILIIGPLAFLGGRGSLVGIAAMLLTAFCLACGTVYGRHAASANPVLLACGQQAFGAVIAGLISCAVERHELWSEPALTWILLVVVGVLCSALPTALYLRLLTRAPSVPAALVAYLQPIWAALLGWALLGEKLGAAALLGSGLIITGIAISTAGPITWRIGTGNDKLRPSSATAIRRATS